MLAVQPRCVKMTLNLANNIRSLQFRYGATSERILPVIPANLTMIAVELAGLTFNLTNRSPYTTLFIAIWQFYFCFYFDCRTCHSIQIQQLLWWNELKACSFYNCWLPEFVLVDLQAIPVTDNTNFELPEVAAFTALH